MIAPRTPVSAPKSLVAPPRPTKRSRGKPDPDVIRILSCWPLPDGKVTSNWSIACSANGADTPEKMKSLSSQVDTKGPFFHLGKQIFTKDFYEYLGLLLSNEDDKAEYEMARRASPIECDCCYFRSINQAFSAMTTHCQLCNFVVSKRFRI
jgi:hypothetical protein